MTREQDPYHSPRRFAALRPCRNQRSDDPSENGCVLLLPEKLSVAQTLKTFQLLTAINAELLFRLAKSSALAHGTENDECNGCHWEKECFQDVLPLCMLAEAGIDPVEGDFECAVKDGTLVLRSGADTNVYE